MSFYNQFTDSQQRFMQSRPVPVRLLGFESDTLKLQNAGWQMSIECNRLPHMAGADIRVAFRHDGLKQIALGMIRMSDRSIHELMFQGQGGYNSPFSHGIEINYMAPSIRLHSVPVRMAQAAQWTAFDARPEFLDMKELDLNELAMFKPIKAGEDFEMYIHKKDEEEILDIILKKQHSRQKEIRENRKRREYMASQNQFDEGLADKVNTDIRAQIIVVGA